MYRDQTRTVGRGGAAAVLAARIESPVTLPSLTSLPPSHVRTYIFASSSTTTLRCRFARFVSLLFLSTDPLHLSLSLPSSSIVSLFLRLFLRLASSLIVSLSRSFLVLSLRSLAKNTV